MLGRFADAGIRLDALIVTVQQNTPRPEARETVGTGARVFRDLRAHWRAWRRWRHVTARIRVVDSLAEPALPRALVRARPDVLVLAGTGIVPAALLAIPSTVTLNAHPGLLPWVRGVCPLEHALLRGVPLGVTVHAVDRGVDTGPIIRRVLLPVGEAPEDRITISRRLEGLAIETLTDTVMALLRRESRPARAQVSRHSYGGWVTDDQRARAVELLTRGEARRLYERWRDACGGEVLPDDDALLPGPGT